MNRLHNALSPYLLQHAGQPVHWQPWDDAAFAQAVRENKPVLLSIGYAACHWCHVMADESFADNDTAALMNADFINIKVDREERPDIDRIYQAAHYLFTRRSGGWPLTMFLTPGGEPFFGGTYFPKTARQGLPALAEVLTRVNTVWRDKQADVQAQNAQIMPLLRSLDEYRLHDSADNAMSEAPLRAAAEQFTRLFDDEHGGLGGAPKFPHPVELSFCLRYALSEHQQTLLEKVHHSLRKMITGGLNDYLGGGFFRYCTDDGWALPHFEKMLYDNGLLLALVAEAGAALNDTALQRAAAATADWALETMQGADGAFYASLDADSPGGEGAFYLWTEAELRRLLSAEQYAALAAHCGFDDDIPRAEGKLHLMQRLPIPAAATAAGISEEHCRALLADAGDRLRQQRRQRPPPPLDDKILTAWNALICRGLSISGRLQQNPVWIAAARRGLDALCDTMRPRGRTIAARRGGQLGQHGFLDDCAFLLDAILEHLRAEFCPQLFAQAAAIAQELCAHYQDEDNGGFFFTANDGEVLIRRLKITDDNATPSGNGVACRALLLLHALSAQPCWRQAAEKALRRFKEILLQQPTAHASIAAAWQYYLAPPTIIYLTGDTALCRQWQQVLDKDADPTRLVFRLPPATDTLPPPLQKSPPARGACAYICDEHGCSAPAATLADVQQLLDK